MRYSVKRLYRCAHFLLISELGSFMKTKSNIHLHLKTKIWIENDDQQLLFGQGKTELLECIEEDGSIARAAEKMGLSYKKAWTHVKTLQQNGNHELVISQKGRGSGGTILTPHAKELIKKYRQLQEDVEKFANKRFEELFEK